MSPDRKLALAAGVFYLLTFVSIPTLFLYDQVRNNPNYILGPGPDTAVLVGAISEIIVALAGGRRPHWAWSARASWKAPVSSLASPASWPS